MPRQDASLRFAGAAGSVAVTICTSRIVRVSLGATQTSGASFVAPRTWASPPFEVADGEPVRIATSDLRLEVETNPLRLTFADAAGAWLVREPADGGMTVEPGADGAGRVRAGFTFSGEQHFYGLGHGGGRLDRLGQGRQLWNSHLGHGPGSDIAIPLLVSNRGYALFFDNPSDAVVAVGRSDNGVRIDYTAKAAALTWYFLLAPDLRSLMGAVAELLGRAQLPPR
jgi:alpha-D-xyloside xylohydrolase